MVIRLVEWWWWIEYGWQITHQRKFLWTVQLASIECLLCMAYEDSYHVLQSTIRRSA